MITTDKNGLRHHNNGSTQDNKTSTEPQSAGVDWCSTSHHVPDIRPSRHRMSEQCHYHWRTHWTHRHSMLCKRHNITCVIAKVNFIQNEQNTEFYQTAHESCLSAFYQFSDTHSLTNPTLTLNKVYACWWKWLNTHICRTLNIMCTVVEHKTGIWGAGSSYVKERQHMLINSKRGVLDVIWRD